MEYFRFNFGVKWRYLAGLVLLFSAIIAFTLVNNANATLDSTLINQGWQEVTFDDLAENHFSALSSGDRAIEIQSRNSVSVAFLPFQSGEINLTKTPYLSFSWQREGKAVNTDLTKKGGDDRIVSIYVAFPYQSEHASTFERLTRTFVESRKGKDAPGRVLSYLWGGGPPGDPVGKWYKNPYTGSAGKMQILQHPGDGENIWFDHRLNIEKDFTAQFGYAPPAPSYIAVTADSDDTKASFTARVKGLIFTK